MTRRFHTAGDVIVVGTIALSLAYCADRQRPLPVISWDEVEGWT